MRKSHTSILLAATALTALSMPSYADEAQTSAPSNPRIEVLEQQLHDLQQQLVEIKGAQSHADDGGAVQDLKRGTSAHYKDVNNRLNSLSNVSVDNGRLSVASADGRFTAALRVLAQFDSGYYSQDHAANLLPASYGNDFSSGSNFRRMYFGLQGKIFDDWSYNVNFDFGGSSGTETPGHIQSVYLEYDGLAPWGLRIGAFPP